MRAILYPTFPCRKIGLSPQRLSSPAPLGSRSPLIRPSVRTGAPSQGEGFGEWCVPFRLQHPPLPARPAGGGPLRALGYGPQARQKKKGGPPQGPPTRKGGSREEEPLPPWCSFLRLSSKKAGLPGPGGQQGAAPQGGFGATHPKGYAVPPAPPSQGQVGNHQSEHHPEHQGGEHIGHLELGPEGQVHPPRKDQQAPQEGEVVNHRLAEHRGQQPGAQGDGPWRTPTGRAENSTPLP